jgi:hypothetical protein
LAPDAEGSDDETGVLDTMGEDGMAVPDGKPPVDEMGGSGDDEMLNAGLLTAETTGVPEGTTLDEITVPDGIPLGPLAGRVIVKKTVETTVTVPPPTDPPAGTDEAGIAGPGELEMTLEAPIRGLLGELTLLLNPNGTKELPDKTNEEAGLLLTGGAKTGKDVAAGGSELGDEEGRSVRIENPLKGVGDGLGTAGGLEKIEGDAEGEEVTGVEERGMGSPVKNMIARRFKSMTVELELSLESVMLQGMSFESDTVLTAPEGDADGCGWSELVQSSPSSVVSSAPPSYSQSSGVEEGSGFEAEIVDEKGSATGTDWSPVIPPVAPVAVILPSASAWVSQPMLVPALFTRGKAKHERPAEQVVTAHLPLTHWANPPWTQA